MPAELKGKTTFVIPEGAKPGDEVEVSAKFTADQEDFDGAVRGRLDQQKRQLGAEKDDLLKQIEDLKAKGPEPKADEKTAKELAKLQEQLASNTKELAQAKLDVKLEGALKKAKLTDLPDEFRDAIKLALNATDDDIEEAVAAAGKKYAALLEKLGVKAEDKEPEEQPTGRRGSGGTKDQKEIETLQGEVNRYRPDLLKMLAFSDDGQKLEIMRNWKAQGLLVAKTK